MARKSKKKAKKAKKKNQENQAEEFPVKTKDGTQKDDKLEEERKSNQTEESPTEVEDGTQTDKVEEEQISVGDEETLDEGETETSSDEMDTSEMSLGEEDKATDIVKLNKQMRFSKRGKHERKARKMFERLGLRTIPGIKRVCIRKTRNILFVIENPEVYKGERSDTYVIFGDCHLEDLDKRAESEAVDRLQKNIGTVVKQSRAKEKKMKAKVVESESEEEALDDLDERDVKLVCEQAGCSRNKAIKALKNCNGEIVDAIMGLVS